MNDATLASPAQTLRSPSAEDGDQLTRRERDELAARPEHAELIADVRWYVGSILWPLFGRLALDQVALPEVAAAVDRSGRFADNFAARGLRSFLFGGLLNFCDPSDNRRFAEDLKRKHAAVQGTGTGDFAGVSYRALDPETWRWVALSGVNLFYQGYNAICGRSFDDDQREVVYQTVRTMLTGLELSNGKTPMPATLAEFADCYHEIANTKLSDNSFLRFASGQFRQMSLPKGMLPRPVRRALRPVWPTVAPIVTRPIAVCSAGVTHPRMKDLLDTQWGTRERIEFAVYTAVLRLAWTRLPKRLTLDPLAYNRYQYERLRDTYYGAQLPSFAPLRSPTTAA